MKQNLGSIQHDTNAVFNLFHLTEGNMFSSHAFLVNNAMKIKYQLVFTNKNWTCLKKL